MGSFSQAAKKLGMPNSTVSAKISNLERRLGVTLIQRTTRKLNITPSGDVYYKKCMLGLEEIKAAEAEIANIQGEPQGLLRVTAPTELGGSVLPSLISAFTKKYPKVRVEILLTDRRVDFLSENVDLAIRAGEMKDSTLIAKRIGSVCFALFASPNYLKQKGTPTHPRDLRQMDCLQFTPLGLEEWKMTGLKGSLNVPISARVFINDMYALKKMAVMDGGIIFLPTSYCYAEVKAKQLVRILPEWRSNLTPVHFVYPAQRFVTPKLSAFISMGSEFIKRAFEDFEI
ncbi:MAG: LysR family transcriptional regulator [Bdellovibrionales bacterium]|nr:LysR family transcriptional regulator [Bdellovibrionales bacterium]